MQLDPNTDLRTVIRCNWTCSEDWALGNFGHYVVRAMFITYPRLKANIRANLVVSSVKMVNADLMDVKAIDVSTIYLCIHLSLAVGISFCLAIDKMARTRRSV